MDINENLSNLMKEAQKMQQRMQEAQEQLTKLAVEGEAGGGMVKITMDGKHNAKTVKINPSLMDDREMLQDLVAAAINDAARKIEKSAREKISQLTEGLNIPKDLLNKEEDKE